MNFVFIYWDRVLSVQVNFGVGPLHGISQSLGKYFCNPPPITQRCNSDTQRCNSDIDITRYHSDLIPLYTQKRQKIS